MRVLLLADECNPEWPSLPVVGYQTCRALAGVTDVTVVTQVRNRPNIERAGCGSARVEYVDTEYVAGPVHRLSTRLRGGKDTGWTLNVAMSYPSYLAFEWEVWRRFGHDLTAGHFDLVHRVTPMSPTLPSPLARWSPVPFVLGPLNGGLRWPRGYGGECRREREWMTHVRAAHRLLPYYRSTYSRPAAILAAVPHTIDSLPAAGRRRAIDFPEVGFDPDTFHPPAVPRHPHGPLTFLFAGRLVPYKCPDVVVEAFALNPALRGHRLWLAGEGPERPLLEHQIEKHRLHGRVELLGGKSQAAVAELMRQADVFVFPSIRELGAGVVVEAMACGLPCVVVDYGGPAGLVAEGTGIKVPLRRKEEMARAFADAMGELADDPERVRELGEAACDLAFREYTWPHKAEKIRRVYEWVLGERRERPRFLEEPALAGAI
jgi:glycosyltransferase involved in cell wall biosynthesis